MILEQIPTGPIGTNCYLLGDEKTRQAMVVDPGSDAPVILDLLRHHDLRVEILVATHGHWDHVGAVRPLKQATGARFLAPAADLEMIRNASASALLLGMVVDPPPDPDGFLEEGDVLQVGELTLRVLSAPGHTPGHVILVGPGFAFVGDVIFAGSVGRTDLPGGDWDTLMESIRTKVLTLPEQTVLYPGHGPPTTVRRERISNPFLTGLVRTRD
ncbi:MAG: MBL fold metallo-hydrolase [Armatimonadota bacterium]|nr:MBL fold metallo-hydrolase [Armatimonadota bacterium]MDR7439398.1 MBL fold metallo-hydrolase [Armatimonadota bacterium]MDR7563039.1 MBL fold metallo-hydrolase [Armatimonadota bacterium]MDR7568510.1 MBL fold metallo-hydrolase [Armatimonadota bacterium]MDR7602768.1 MBL fold metallo-hydrolase [Armatimonadota bacterium]